MNEEKKEYNSGRRREIIKTILIIFLAAMLVLTFLSNTIMNKSLSEITTESAMSGKLTERIRGSGLIESNQSYEVKIDENKTIDTIMINYDEYMKITTGQEVKKGDVLFTVGTEENEEIETAESELINLELEYQKALLGVPVDYTAENQAINTAREELNTAIERRNNAISNSGSAEQALYDYTNNKSQLTSKSATLEKIQSTITAFTTHI